MSYSYLAVGFVAASCLWALAGGSSLLCCKASEPRAFANPLAVKGSPYGSLVAGLMKNSMHDYWHAGQHSPHQDPLKRLGTDGPSTACGSWLTPWINRLSELDEARMLPTSKIAISRAHRRYLDAAANWHLRIAYLLDPGDAALYEVSHYAVMACAEGPETGRIGAGNLAAMTIEHALSEQGGMSAALTGAGAAINLLNNDMVAGSEAKNDVLLAHWDLLKRCLKRYGILRRQAEAEGWWDEVPQIRRGEIVSYAALLERLASTIRRRLVATAVLGE